MLASERKDNHLVRNGQTRAKNNTAPAAGDAGQTSVSARQILRNKRFLDIYLKVLKEDYYLIGERKSKLDTTQVAAPILALGGTEDELYNSVDGWKKHTRSLFCYQMIEGKHFFIKNNPMLVAEQINKMGVEINDES